MRIPASADTAGMPHYHAWLRTGRIFTMSPRRFDERSTGHRWAAKRRPAAADRLVLACTDCPTSRPSRRRSPRPAVVARAIAEAVGAPVAQVRQALDAANAAERGRDRHGSAVT